MASEAKETARLYAILTDKLGADTTEAMFKYIDNKAERAVESKILSLATKNDVALLKSDIYLLMDDLHSTKDELRKEIGAVRDDLREEIGVVRNDLHQFKYELSKDISNSVKWMFIFWIGQMGAILAIVFLFLKK